MEKKKPEVKNLKPLIQKFANWLALDKERYTDFEVEISIKFFKIRRLN